MAAPGTALAGAASPTWRASTSPATRRDDELKTATRRRGSAGGFTFLSGSFADIALDEAANKTAADFVRGKIDEIVRDQDTAAMLKPRDFPIGTKRLPLDTGYYETFNRTNVTLVDLSGRRSRRSTRPASGQAPGSTTWT